ncbi:hypothetical protein KIN20_026134 [Parelaphostrongylus tenuis]|uniref:Uncharacterized protein n=1 Tax=Parelaphostrongylus tenuis TaxID=148309 RepID=A0AAD5N070_PARTN|nr:hypothetical protein KIN20_026134 [Parelaphostrongylus tenuis]
MGVEPHCIIIGNTVTSVCTGIGANNDCDISMGTKISAIPSSHSSISGSLTITNIIMANWSRQMWQSIVNRAVRILASCPFGSHSVSAFATVGYNLCSLLISLEESIHFFEFSLFSLYKLVNIDIGDKWIDHMKKLLFIKKWSFLN